MVDAIRINDDVFLQMYLLHAPSSGSAAKLYLTIETTAFMPLIRRAWQESDVLCFCLVPWIVMLGQSRSTACCRLMSFEFRFYFPGFMLVLGH